MKYYPYPQPMSEDMIKWITNLPDNVYPLTVLMGQYVYTYCGEVDMPPEPGQSFRSLYPLAKRYYKQSF